MNTKNISKNYLNLLVPILSFIPINRDVQDIFTAALKQLLFIRLIPNHSIGDKVSVEAVKITLELKEVYIIRGKAYYVWNFRITREN